MKVAVLGSGVVGEVLADGFLKKGYEVMRGTRDPQKLADWKTAAGAKASTGTFEEAARAGSLLVLAVKGSAAETVIQSIPKDALRGKTILDATNPIADLPPVGGVLQFFTGPNQSLMETLQKLAPEAEFVKCFSCVGNAWMVDPNFPGGKPTMFICGNSEAAKRRTSEVLTQFGWESADMGGVEAARAIEPLCQLWCLPGILRNEWGHAFKLLKQ
jgi:predicted dinucleotide-binding enzyme